MNNWTDPTDICTASNISINAPLSMQFPQQPYIAIGPISNFTSTIQSCCQEHGQVKNYNGGPSANSCYYYCPFNGTLQEFREAMDCNSEAARERRKNMESWKPTAGFLTIGWHPDLASSATGSYDATNRGVWRWSVLGLAFLGAMAGAM